MLSTKNVNYIKCENKNFGSTQSIEARFALIKLVLILRWQPIAWKASTRDSHHKYSSSHETWFDVMRSNSIADSSFRGCKSSRD